MKLYDIPIQAAEIEAELADNFGELTPEIEQRIAAFLSEGKDKIEASAMVIRSLEADAAICQEEADRLMKRANGLESGAKRLKGLVLLAVDEGFGGKLKTPKFTIWGQTSPAVARFELRPGASIHQVPVEFLRTRDPELDKPALKAAKEAGIPMPDCLDVEEMPGTRYLRIK